MVPVSQPSKQPTQPAPGSNTVLENGGSGGKPSPGKIVGRLSGSANAGNKSPTKMVNGTSKVIILGKKKNQLIELTFLKSSFILELIYQINSLTS